MALFLFFLASPVWYILILGKIVEKTEGKGDGGGEREKKKEDTKSGSFQIKAEKKAISTHLLTVLTIRAIT